ncbi:FAD-dependent tricarballylate dehydrogenase TcuA [Litorivicinus sp.]|nr:FAD-dependent tricarballylate dehydrogenase TcuA [Litorivicinus sp.]MDC1208979.1 FAD-dependent tricarballylate dehydrogenase TcuA [Litorivicinus sp.]
MTIEIPKIEPDKSLIRPGIGSIDYDVIVVGGGNAALCAAIRAAELGASVLVLERAPFAYRGGNSRHTRNFRCMHPEPQGVLTGAYLEEEFFDDLIRVTKGKTDEHLARLAIRESAECYEWMQSQGVYFQESLSGTLSLSRTNAFFLGGGKALVNAYYNRLENLGARVLLEATVVDVHVEEGLFDGVLVDYEGRQSYLRGRCLVLASGGFEADKEWLTRAWGEAAKNFLIRGTPYNTGEVLKNLLDQGADQIGEANQCHAVAIDGRAPEYDGGIVTRVDCVPFSVVVNERGERFYDEGEDVWPKRYAIWGRLVAAQPNQVGYAIIDKKSRDLFMPTVFEATKTESLAEMAIELGIAQDALLQTVSDFNESCVEGAFTPTELDGLSTQGLKPPKTNWARPLDTPPFYGYELRPGVTFTYLGFRVEDDARVSFSGKRSANIWAAGEIMAGSILGEGYLAGFGMTIGTVFGRIAGKEAAEHAIQSN